MQKQENIEISTPDNWDEDLLWQASRALELGRTHCTCSTFHHLLWPLLRASGYVGEPKKNETRLISSTISPFIRGGSKVLIGGSVDPGQFCALRRIAGALTPDITIIDRCAAPLKLIREYAASRNAMCTTIHADILNLDGRTKWEVIYLHYTTVWIDRRCRRQFFRCLAESLAPNGVLICVDKMGMPPDDGGLKKLEQAYLVGASKALQDSDFNIYWRQNELENMLRRYVAGIIERRVNYPTFDEMDELLPQVGLRLVSREGTALERVVTDSDQARVDTRSSSITVATRGPT